MNCTEFSNLLDDLLAGRLAPADAERLRAHAAQCAECAHLLAVRMDCQALDEELETSDRFAQGWRQRIREEEKMEEKRQRKKSWRAWAAAAAAAVFILGGTLLQQGLREREEDYDYDAPTVYRSAASDSGYSGQVALGAASNFKMGSSYESAGAEQYSDDAQAQEKIIRTAGFTLKTTAFDADLQAFEELVQRFGGRVEAFYQSGDAGAGEARSASLTLRIPADKLDAFLEGSQALGRITSLHQEQEDVSENYYDLQTRLQTQQEKMDRLQALLKQAENVSDLIEIENAIADTQYTLDRYTGQLQHYDSQVEYSTVQVSLREIRMEESEEAGLGEKLMSGLRDSWTKGVAFLQDALVFLFSALPWLAAAAAVIAAVRLIVKKKKSNK